MFSNFFNRLEERMNEATNHPIEIVFLDFCQSKSKLTTLEE